MMKLKDLGITGKERNALLDVAAALDSGTLKHTTETNDGPAFNIDITADNNAYECGTVCCIGGWASILMQGGTIQKEQSGDLIDKADDYVRGKTGCPIEALYYPSDVDDWSDITPPVAVAAIHQFLATGKVDYNELIAEHGE